MSRIRLIVNGDDFGRSAEVNEGIIRAHRDGLLTSCSLMVTGAAFEEAVRLAKESPGLAVGIHLVTVMGRSVLPKHEIPTLVDDSGNFSNNPTLAGLRYYFSPQSRHELKRELAAQFEKFESTGLPLSHIDGHLHLHIHPVIFQTAMELGAKYGTKRMRVPVEPLRLSLGFDSSARLRKNATAFIFGLLARRMKRQLKTQGFVFPDQVYGNLQSGKMSEEYFLYVVNHLAPSDHEIYFHPAVFGDLLNQTPEMRQQQREYEAMVSERVKSAIAEHGVILMTYRELEEHR